MRIASTAVSGSGRAARPPSVAVARLAVLAVLVGLLLAPVAAHARTVAKTDPAGDAATHLDLTRVVYANGDRVVSVRLRVPGLQRRGSARVMVGVPYSDVGYFVRGRVRADGTVAKRLFYSTATTQSARACRGLVVRWLVGDKQVVVRVPQSCLSAINKRRAYAFGAAVGPARTGDYAPPVYRLARG